MKAKSSRIIVFTFLALALFGVQAAHAALAEMGPVDPVRKFPTWYMDETGLAVELCLNANRCAFEPVVAGNQASEDAGFGAEAFYWAAEVVRGPSAATDNVDVLFVLALEAAWATLVPAGEPAPNQQSVFSRLRVRLSPLPGPGVYRIDHPYGTLNLPAEQDNKGVWEINFTRDIGVAARAFEASLKSPNVGPFLQHVGPRPAGFLGSVNQTKAVIGGPQRNTLVVTGPGVDFTISTWALWGKKATNGGLTVKPSKVTYSRSATRVGTVNVVADSIGKQNIQVTGVGSPATSVRMTADPNIAGRYTAAVPFKGKQPFSPVTVTNLTDRSNPTFTGEARDKVTISSATWSPAAGASEARLIVRATSSDLVPFDAADPTSGPRLQVFVTNTNQSLGFINKNGVFSKAVSINPGKITVRSTKGGVAGMTVTTP